MGLIYNPNWPYRSLRSTGRDARNWIEAETHEEKIFPHQPIPWHCIACGDDTPYAMNPKLYHYEAKKKVISKHRRAARNQKYR